MADLHDLAYLETRVRRLANGFQKRYGDLLQYDVEKELAVLKVFLLTLDGRVNIHAHAISGNGYSNETIHCRSSSVHQGCKGSERENLGRRRKRDHA